MTPYEALAHAFSTMPTGGFSTQPDSAEAFSADVAVDPRVLHVARRSELRAHVPRLRAPASARRSSATRSSASTSRSSLGASCRASPRCSGGTASPRARRRCAPAVFQAVSIMTTTGMASADFALWPALLLLCALRAHVRRAARPARRAARSRSCATSSSARCSAARSTRRSAPRSSCRSGSTERRSTSARFARSRRSSSSTSALWAVGASVIAIDSAITGVGLGTLDALGGVGDDARQHRPGVRDQPGRWARSPSSATSRRSR